MSDESKEIPSTEPARVSRYRDIQELLAAQGKAKISVPWRIQSPRYLRQPEQSIPDKIETTRRILQNAAFEQDMNLKKNTLIILFIFLAIETVVIFIITFLQGFKAWGFALQEWSFRLLISATITQITVMLLVAVQHLFPRK